MRETIAEESVTKLSINDIKPNMVLARDIIIDNGKVVLARDTMLNSVNYSRLVSSGVEDVYVISDSISEQAEDFTESDQTSLQRQKIPVEDRPEFIAFRDVVETKTEKAKECIRIISDGGQKDLNEMYAITDDIMSTLRFKNELLTFLGFIKQSDEHTFHHCVNVSLLCNLYGQWLALSSDELVRLTTAGLLHDIGKTKVPKEILNKKGKLTDEEFAIIKKHPILGYRILQNQDIPECIKLGALMHHERIDGSGYPMGLKGDKIDKVAKIISICDIYDAMTANRVYRSKICPFEVIKTFETRVYGELDTYYLLVFLKNIASTYIGSWVKLTNGLEAEVVFINKSQLSRPIVRSADETFIDLSRNKDVSIDSLV